jgi:hypothetical protein
MTDKAIPRRTVKNPSLHGDLESVPRRSASFGELLDHCSVATLKIGIRRVVSRSLLCCARGYAQGAGRRRGLKISEVAKFTLSERLLLGRLIAPA